MRKISRLRHAVVVIASAVRRWAASSPAPSSTLGVAPVEPLETRQLLSSTVVLNVNGDAGPEGQPRTVGAYAYVIPDEGESDVPIDGFDVTWGDGTSTHAGAVMNYAGNWFPDAALTHTYNTVGTYNIVVTATATDDDGTQAQATANDTIQVTDALIHATGANAVTAVPNQEVNAVVATFTDDDPDGQAGNYTVTIDWGDGNTGSGTVTAGDNGTFIVTGQHTYAQAGSFNASVLIEDPDGASGTASTDIEVGPNVTVASVNDGAEDGDAPALVRFTRDGPTDNDLTVYYTLAGTATPDTGSTVDGDYTAPTPAYYDGDGNPVYAVTILAGDTTADVSFTPENDALCEGDETIQVALADGPAGTQPAYNKGGPATTQVSDLVATKVDHPLDQDTLDRLNADYVGFEADDFVTRYRAQQSMERDLAADYRVAAELQRKLNDPDLPAQTRVSILAALGDVPQAPVSIEVSNNKLTVTITAPADINVRWSYAIIDQDAFDPNGRRLAIVYPEGGSQGDSARDDGQPGNTGAMKSMLIKPYFATAAGADAYITVTVVEHYWDNGPEARSWEIPIYVKIARP